MSDPTCSHIRYEVKEGFLKDLSNTKFKERLFAKKKNLQSKSDKDQGERKGTSTVCITKVQRRMSMLEWRTTTKDDEVTKGRWYHNMITTTPSRTKINEWRKVIHQRSQSMIGTNGLSKAITQRLKVQEEQATKIKDQGHKREISMITLRGRLLELEVLIIYVSEERSEWSSLRGRLLGLKVTIIIESIIS